METLLATGDDDFSFSVAGLGRFRCNAYKQRGSLSAVLRVVAFGLPDYRQLGIPETVIGLSEKRKGLVLITGSAGSGKSTTMACIVDRINQTRTGHIITIEDPIEYLHPHNALSASGKWTTTQPAIRMRCALHSDRRPT